MNEQSFSPRDPRSFLNPVVDYQKASADCHEFVHSPVSRVLVIYTGGTIGMKGSTEGYAPVANWFHDTLLKSQRFHEQADKSTLELKELVIWSTPCQEQDYEVSRALLPALRTPQSIYGKRIQYVLLEYSPLLDSANMTMTDWVKIATDIELNYNNFDAFVILHGTDTMAYTASVLSFMLENLGKSVIITGSQVPLAEWRTDAEENLLGALLLAGHFVIPEVTVFFSNRLLRGNRVVKIDALDFTAFESPNMRELATMGVNIDVNWKFVRRPTSASRFCVHRKLSHKIVIIRLFPGISGLTMKSLLGDGVEGAVLETFGAGNAPSNRPDLLQVLKEACDRGVVVVNITQCKRGMVSDLYETGKALSNVGVIAGGDMTPECAFTKLSYLLGKGLPHHEIRSLAGRNIRGELTVLAPAAMEGSKASFQFLDALLESMNYVSSSEKQVVERAILPQLICSVISLDNREMFHQLCQWSENTRLVVNLCDYEGRTPLHIASSRGSTSIVELLLDYGASVHLRDMYGNSPLGLACSRQHSEVARLLFKAGANIDRDDKNAIMSYYNACVRGDVDKVMLFIECGLHPNTTTTHRQTALHLAYIYRHKDLASLLLSLPYISKTFDVFGKLPEDYDNNGLVHLDRNSSPWSSDFVE